MLIMKHSENFTGPWKTDTLTFLITTQYFTLYSLLGRLKLDIEVDTILSTSELELVLWRGGDLFSYTALVTLK